jgi:hypothetical protein
VIIIFDSANEKEQLSKAKNIVIELEERIEYLSKSIEECKNQFRKNCETSKIKVSRLVGKSLLLNLSHLLNQRELMF